MEKNIKVLKDIRGVYVKLHIDYNRTEDLALGRLGVARALLVEKKC